MKLLVTGATGFIGVQVVEEACRAGHDVRALVRRPDRAPLVARHDVEVVHGDLTAPASLHRAVDGVDGVIHLAGRATFERYDRLAPTLVDGTRTLASAAAEAGVERFVFGSSAFVYPGGDVGPTTPPDPAIDYGRAKVDAERAIDDATAGAGMSVGHLRFPHVYGPQSLLFGLVRRRLVPFPGDGENRFAQLHVTDAARLAVAAVEQGWSGAAPVSDVAVPGAATPTWNEFFEILARFAPRVRVLRVPRRLAMSGASLLSPLLGRLAPTMVAPDTIRGWNLDLAIDGAAAWSELGITPRYGHVADGIPATLDGVVAFRWRHPVYDFS